MNELKKTDYERLEGFLEEHPGISLEVLPSVDLEFISANPIVVAVEGYGYRVSTEIMFRQPIGFEIHDSLKLDDETRSCLAVNRRSFGLSKIVAEPVDLQKDLDLLLNMMERIVNHISSRFSQMVEQTCAITSELIDRQFETVLQKEELIKRGEEPRPFGMIHAGGSKNAKERSGNLVPLYWERDKAYLYEDKKVYILLPRNFIMKLLKLKGIIMVPIDQFTDAEREVLKQFSLRRYVRTRKILGKTYYSDLDTTTRKLLVKGMKK
jgi:hypothetical protein